MNEKVDGVYLAEVRSVQNYKETSFSLLGLKAGYTVLDVGCGIGADVLELAKFVAPTGWVVGIYNDPEMIKASEERGKDSGFPVEFKLGDAHQLPFSDGTFDAVRTDRILQHVGASIVLEEMCRVLKPGGVVVVAEPDWGTLVIDSPNSTATLKVVNEGTKKLIPNPWIGRSLFRLLGLLVNNLRDIKIFAITDCITDFEKARRIFRLDRLAEVALESEEREDWLISLERRGRAGTFFSSITMYIASGRKKLK